MFEADVVYTLATAFYIFSINHIQFCTYVLCIFSINRIQFCTYVPLFLTMYILTGKLLNHMIMSK